MNLNKVFIIGRLTADPQLRTTPGGQSVSSFGVATNRIWTDKQGARQEETEYHNVVVWGKSAEIASQFLKKGSTVFIEGRLRTRTWQDKQNQNRRTTEIVCERLQLGPRPFSSFGKRGASAPGAEESAVISGAAKEPVPEYTAEELPSINIEDEIKPEDLPF